MTPTYAARLGLDVRPTNVGAQKIDGSALKTYEIVTTGFLVYDKLDRVQFFEKTFLLANISIEVVLEMPFLSFSNINIEFTKAERFI